MAMNHAGACTPVLLRLGLGVIGLCIAGYILGPPLYWHLKEGVAAFSDSSLPTCPTCDCDCSSQPPLSISEALSNGSFTDCVKHDREVGEDTEKNYADILSEELKLREKESLESQQRGNMALLEAKKLTSAYQKEADKCNSGMETCEGAREKAEQALAVQKKLSAVWEFRARQKGWKEGMTTKKTSQSQGNVQSA